MLNASYIKNILGVTGLPLNEAHTSIFYFRIKNFVGFAVRKY